MSSRPGIARGVLPRRQETAEGFIIYGGDITQAFSGDYTSNMLARSTGSAFIPLFEHFGLEARPVETREEIEDVLDEGGLVWMKATVDFLPWANVTWVTPDGKELPGVLGNDHAVVVIGYNDAGPVIRDVLGPTNTNWERPTEGVPARLLRSTARRARPSRPSSRGWAAGERTSPHSVCYACFPAGSNRWWRLGHPRDQTRKRARSTKRTRPPGPHRCAHHTVSFSCRGGAPPGHV